MMRFIRLTLEVLFELIALPFLAALSVMARLSPKKIDVGLGPEPLINNVYHKRALEQRGWSAETFVHEVYHITQEFDVRGDLWLGGKLRNLRLIVLYVRAIFRYRCLYFYFHGGALGFTRILWLFEPLLLRVSGVKSLVMPYGSDVQDLLRTPNLAFRHVTCSQYPGARWRRKIIDLKIDLWTLFANHIIGGCDWVDYMYHWDTLMPAHFSIDVSQWEVSPAPERDTIKVLHAPNHRLIKGTDFFVRAVEELAEEGLPVELVLVEKVSNSEVKRLMRDADIIADQLIIGWYAMFALEAMAMGKPVLCYLRDDLLELYRTAGVLDMEEHPIVSVTPFTVKERLRGLIRDRSALKELGMRSRQYVERYHSTESVGGVFDEINKTLLGTK